MEWFEPDDQEALEQQQRQPYVVIILFPLVSEDPIAETRLAFALEGMLPSGRERAASSLGGGAGHAQQPQHGAEDASASCAQRHVAWSAFPASFEAVASRCFSQHMLLKVKAMVGMRACRFVCTRAHPFPPSFPGAPAHMHTADGHSRQGPGAGGGAHRVEYGGFLQRRSRP